MSHEDLAAYIVGWLCRRNDGELKRAFHSMSVADNILMHEELAHILKHGGHPPNWGEANVKTYAPCSACGAPSGVVGPGVGVKVYCSKCSQYPLIKVAYPPTCRKCNDRGVIETGNNDLPCDCSAGDCALFNTEYGRETGAQIKARRR